VPSQPHHAPAHVFQTTRWSLVLKARADIDSDAALETLCRNYWYPLYAFARRSGHDEHAAQDLTQEFFARLLQKNWLRDVDPHRGKFRSFLLMALKRFMANEWDRSQRQKRGGGKAVVPLDTAEAETRYRSESLTSMDDHLLFDRRWALTLLEQSLQRLEAESVTAGKASEFEVLKSCLIAERGQFDCASAAATLGSSEPTVRVAVHRLRKRYREIFREEIAHTLTDPADMEDEVRHLINVLAQA
jgi:RNA polymerase sigma-70 factor (ECF subfamily)